MAARRSALAICCALALPAAGGCGGDSSAERAGAVATDDPVRTFAPLIQTAYGGAYRPMSADWFLERSVVRTAPAGGPYAGRRFRDLDDSARGGPRTLERTPVYFERHREDGGRLRISYWMLYGFQGPGEGAARAPHEGGWQRVDVLVDDLGEDRYRPVGLRLDFDPADPAAAGARAVPWRRLSPAGGTHARLVSRGDDHRLWVAAGSGCGGCTQWETWKVLRDARDQPWAGFDGPWGELGATVAASGPVGPAADAEPSPDADEAEPVETDDPERAFAPLVELAARDRHRPLSARGFIEHSMLWLAEDRCEDREIAVGRGLPEFRTEVTDWIFLQRVGITSRQAYAYYRNPYDENCDLDLDQRIYSDQLTRPHDPGPGRAPGAPPAVGFYLDLDDSKRGGEPSPAGVPAYVERIDEGDSGVRLTYWMLFGMHAPPAGPSHEGDWKRVDVLLREEGDGRYVPLAVQLDVDAGEIDPGERGEVAWESLARVDGTHPRVASAAGSHSLAPASVDTPCDGCVPWRTWEALRPAREQLWYGFGGAWGEVGATEATTGPLGPHGHWPTEEQSSRL